MRCDVTAYDNGQSPDIFRPNYVWSNHIWPDKFIIHYQWGVIEYTKEKQMSRQALVFIISTVT